MYYTPAYKHAQAIPETMRGLFVCALALTAATMADAQCSFFKDSCILDDHCLDDNSNLRDLPSKNHRRCMFCYLDGTESVGLGSIFRQDVKFSGPENEGCPILTTGDSHIMVTYLEVCDEVRLLTKHLSLRDKINNMRSGSWPTPDANCTTIEHKIELPLFSTKEVMDFSSGIRVASTYVNTFDLLSSCGIGEKKRTTNNTLEDYTYAHITRLDTGTRECNVVNTGMRDIVFDHIVMNNTQCVKSQTAGNSKLQDGKCPLSDFAPDSMEVFRLSPMFSFLDPEEVELRYVKLSTFEKYRDACPGRALMSADQLNAKKYPPDPINIDKFCLDYVEDVHGLTTKSNGTVEPDLEDPNETPATFKCPPEIPLQISNFCLETPRDDGSTLILSNRSLEWPTNTFIMTQFNNSNGTLVNKTLSIRAQCPPGKTLNPNTQTTKNPTCVPSEDVVNNTYPQKGPRPVPVCPYGHTPIDNPNLPDNPGSDYNSSADTTSAGGSNTPFLCAPTKFNSIGSRPIDVTLWDFEGSVFFGNNWPAESTGRTFTVLVFGDKISGNASTTKLKDGEVFEDYFDNTTGTRLGVFLPDRRINLLDSSDFYDIAEDEFGCFDKKDAECPDEDMTFETLLILGILTFLTGLHHHMTSSHEDIGCIITPEMKKNQ